MRVQNLNEFQIRLKKAQDLRKDGINPYPNRFERTHTANEALDEGESGTLREVAEILKKPAKSPLNMAGRLMTFREHGKLSFAHLQDFSGKIQICFMEDLLGREKYNFLRKIDVADFIGVDGELFKTKHGETTLLVYEFKLLSKALRALPEKWHGIKDQETKYRQRYLDTVMSRESMDRFTFRSNLIKTLREFYWSEGFTELETPVLENISSGAAAKPFTTHHNALDIDVYLRIAAGELWQKMAVVGGFEKTFEVARCFRNEGMDPSHLQEFTMIEHYAAYWDFEDNMKFTERMFEYFLNKMLGTTKVKVKDRDGNEVEVDFKAPWPRARFTDIIKKDCGIDVLKYSEAEDLLKEIKEKGIVIEGSENLGYGNLVDHLYKKVSRPKLIQPTFVIHHPVSTKPLARKNDEDGRLADTFQLLVNTWEVINAYSEIVDPTDQRERFEKQALAKAQGDEEAMMMNEEYLTAMEHGMPCMSGWGMGIDRLVTLLTEQENLKDAVLFPLLKPLEDNGPKEKPEVKTKAKKVSTSNELPDERMHRFIAILNKKLPYGQLMNAMGHMTAGLTGGVAEGVHPGISHFPFIVLAAENSNQIRKVREEAIKRGLAFTDFTSSMTVGSSTDQQKLTKETAEADLEYYGICLFGPTEELKQFTGKFSLFK